MSDLTITKFLAEHDGRAPQLGHDPIPPWRYRGWLLWYVQRVEETSALVYQMARDRAAAGLPSEVPHGIPLIQPRWIYLLCCHHNGVLPDEPLPQISFHYAPGPYKQIERAMKVLSNHGGWSSFTLLVDWLAWGLGVSKSYPRVDDKHSEQLYRLIDISEWMAAPWDYLGNYLAEQRSGGWNPNAFYPTPSEVVEIMVRMTMLDAQREHHYTTKDGFPDLRHLTVCDPALGSGIMLLHASNYSMRLYGQDKDGLVVDIAKINMALYAPWGVCPLPDDVWKRHIEVTLPARARWQQIMALLQPVSTTSQEATETAQAEISGPELTPPVSPAPEQVLVDAEPPPAPAAPMLLPASGTVQSTPSTKPDLELTATQLSLFGKLLAKA